MANIDFKYTIARNAIDNGEVNLINYHHLFKRIVDKEFVKFKELQTTFINSVYKTLMKETFGSDAEPIEKILDKYLTCGFSVEVEGGLLFVKALHEDLDGNLTFRYKPGGLLEI